MKRITAPTSSYLLELPGHDWYESRVTGLRDARNTLHAARQAGLTMKVTRIVKLRTANACSWCRARPRAWDWDCDGAYEDAVCDSDQCREGRRLADDGIIAYPSYQRTDQSPRLVQPIRVRSTDTPRPGVVTVDEWNDITCLCGNIPSYAGFHECLPGGALVGPDHPQWNGLWWCAGVGCPGVIVDCRYLDRVQVESITDAFPVEWHDQCGDCTAHKDAPPMEHSVGCTIHWTTPGEADEPTNTLPDELDCYACNGFTGVGVKRRVVALGDVVDRADPTQTYKLACGHTAI
ncbi:hypothetical protein ACQP1V_42950 (plasmid) [Microtetraspora malaysiensis]|uniref:hypothetical protein n=1 Tax=Microtetraspora malaysiensis TaxID=161358 RepID=UPI003D8CAEB0